jgi:LysR family transcriptional regulator, hydrogen peroxide-inducible genes activator
MQTSDISLKDLEYVLSVAQHLSFSRAAEACAISQPALSKQIKNLETLLGITLFERNKRQVLLTDSGTIFIAQAKRVLEEADRLRQIITPDQPPLTGLFRLGVIASSGPYLLPHFIGEAQQFFPQLKLLITEGLTEHLISELRQGRLDAVIAATTFEDSQLSHIPLFFEPFLLAVSKRTHSRQPGVISLQDVDRSQLLLLEDGHCLKDQTTALCAISQNQAGQQFKATSLETLLQMTAGGLGISVIPALAQPDKSKLAEQLSFSQFSEPESGRVMALYFRKQTPFIDNMRHLSRLICATLPKNVQVLLEAHSSNVHH